MVEKEIVAMMKRRNPFLMTTRRKKNPREILRNIWVMR
jgi:hypothetical protein